MSVILISGAEGQVGKELLHWSNDYPQFTFLGVGKTDLDISRPDAVRHFFRAHQIDYCVNCAAYTAVDLAETERAAARSVNVEGAANLARECADQQVPMIHLSSDYVYHNSLNRPLLEADPTTPKGIYAQSKLDADLQVLKIHSEALVIRSSWIYSAFGKNFVHTMLRLGNERESVKVVYDQIGAPTYARDLAAAILSILLQKEEQRLPPGVWKGVYHYANEGVCSWYDIAVSIFELSGMECRVIPIESKDFPAAAPRPSFSVLNKEKIKATFGLEIPHWRMRLQDCLERIARQKMQPSNQGDC